MAIYSNVPQRNQINAALARIDYTPTLDAEISSGQFAASAVINQREANKQRRENRAIKALQNQQLIQAADVKFEREVMLENLDAANQLFADKLKAENKAKLKKADISRSVKYVQDVMNRFPSLKERFYFNPENDKEVQNFVKLFDDSGEVRKTFGAAIETFLKTQAKQQEDVAKQRKEERLGSMLQGINSGQFPDVSTYGEAISKFVNAGFTTDDIAGIDELIVLPKSEKSDPDYKERKTNLIIESIDSLNEQFPNMPLNEKTKELYTLYPGDTDLVDKLKAGLSKGFDPKTLGSNFQRFTKFIQDSKQLTFNDKSGKIFLSGKEINPGDATYDTLKESFPQVMNYLEGIGGRENRSVQTKPTGAPNDDSGIINAADVITGFNQ